jgi:hypothetical protein
MTNLKLFIFLREHRANIDNILLFIQQKKIDTNNVEN